MLPGPTDAVEELARELGMTVNWTKFNEQLTADPEAIVAVLYAASTWTFARSTKELHQPLIDQALSAAKGQAGLTDEETLTWAVGAFNLGVNQHDEAQAALSKARELTAQLVERGVFQPPATD